MTSLVVAVVAALAMEPFAAFLHRLLMHRRGWAWHRSHHRRARGGLEGNDAYPVLFGITTIAAMAAGSRVDRLAPLLWAGAGVTVYGVGYLVVHDLYVHERLGPVPGRHTRYVQWVARSHAHHHRDGGAPYGFLVPVVPARRRTGQRDQPTLARGARIAIGRVATATPAPGSPPQ